MKAAARAVVVFSFVASFAVNTAVCLAQETKKQPTSSISGRVTLGGKPAPRVIVLLTPADRFTSGRQSPPPLKATTDEAGRYRITGVEAGNYRIAPHAPAYVAGDAGPELNQSVSITDADEATDIDFSLKRGGVITGRVVDADGKPVIGKWINLLQVDERGIRLGFNNPNPSMFTSDDRGVYRMYGLAPGRYKVSMGDAPDSGMMRMNTPGANYALTFHPDVVDEARARIIDLSAGGEATGIDITMGRPAKTYAASGRIIDAETGTPIPGIRYGHGALSPDQRSIGAFGTSNNRSSSNGEFMIEGLAPGRYTTFALPEGQTEYYSEATSFDVIGGDVGQLEIKLRRASSISGVAVLEGTDDAEAVAKLAKLDLRAFVSSQQPNPPQMGPARVGPDGGFRITGLGPGKARIQLGNYPPIKGLVLLRIEQDGVEHPDGIEIGPGENVAGVRVILGYGTGTIRGQVKMEGGEKPANARLLVNARQLNSRVPYGRASAQADARGRFSFEGLVPGEYEIEVRLIFLASRPSPGAPSDVPPPPRPARSVSASQRVVVTDGAVAEITIVLNLDANDNDRER